MPTLIFDIETVGEDFSAMDEATKENLTWWLKREPRAPENYAAELKNLEEGLGFSPLTGEIVALGVLDVGREKAAVFYQSGDGAAPSLEEENCKYEVLPEREMIARFWDIAQKFDTFVTFNGRGFDVPFLWTRSAVHGIRPTKNLMSNRYLNYQPREAQHVDLLEQLSFYGATRRKGSLHLWTRALGITSPKTQGITGDDVQALYREGKYMDIARYNARDLFATLALYRKYQEYFVLSHER